MAELKDLALRVARALNQTEIRYVIVGGFAVIARGMPRTTMDVDLIVEDDAEKIALLFAELKGLNFDIMARQTQNALLEGTNISVFDELSPLRIDLKIARKDEDRMALDYASWEDFEGEQIRVASPELILFGKVLYLGDISDIPDSEFLEYGDIKDFLAVFQNAASINLTWLREKVAEAGLTETLNRLVAAAENFDDTE